MLSLPGKLNKPTKISVWDQTNRPHENHEQLTHFVKFACHLLGRNRPPKSPQTRWCLSHMSPLPNLKFISHHYEPPRSVQFCPIGALFKRSHNGDRKSITRYYIVSKHNFPLTNTEYLRPVVGWGGWRGWGHQGELEPKSLRQVGIRCRLMLERIMIVNHCFISRFKYHGFLKCAASVNLFI